MSDLSRSQLTYNLVCIDLNHLDQKGITCTRDCRIFKTTDVRSIIRTEVHRSLTWTNLFTHVTRSVKLHGLAWKIQIENVEIFYCYLPLYQRQRVSIHSDNHIYFVSFLLQDFLNSDLIRCCQHNQSRDFRVVLCAFARALDRQSLIDCLLETCYYFKALCLIISWK